MSTKHTVQFEGHTFKRKSAGRKYSHLVVVLSNIAQERVARAAYTRKTWEINVAYHTEYANGTSKFIPVPDYVLNIKDPVHRAESIALHEKQKAAQIAESKALLAAGVEGYVARALEAFDEHVPNATKTADGVDFIGVAGWASRQDLAQKLANRHPRAVILQAVQS